MAFFFFFSFAILHEGVQAQGAGTCYTPQGVPLEGQQACIAYGQSISSCCPIGTTCFSNQLCILTDPEEATDSLPLGTVLRGGCTNPLWSNSFCGSFCLNNGDNGLITDCGNEQYCCQSGIDDGSCDCDSGKGTFSLADGVAQTIIGVSGLDATTIPPVSRSLSRITTTIDTSALITTSPSTASILQSSSSSPSTTASTSSASAQASPTEAPSSAHKSHLSIGLGVGLGGSFALILFGVLIWWCMKHRPWPIRRRTPDLNPYPYPTTTNSDRDDDGRTPYVAQPTTAPFPHPYEPSAVGSDPTPVSTPPPQMRPGHSNDVLGIAPMNNPYDSAYSLRSRGADGVGNIYPHPYSASPPLERVGETEVPQRAVELMDLPKRSYGNARRPLSGMYDGV